MHDLLGRHLCCLGSLDFLYGLLGWLLQLARLGFLLSMRGWYVLGCSS